MMATVLHIFEEMSFEELKASFRLGQEWLAEKEFGPFINGTWEPKRKEYSCRVTTDSIQGTNASVRTSDSEDLQKAVNSCLDAQEIWCKSGINREFHFLNVVKTLEKHAALLAQVEAINRGVPAKGPVEFDVPALISWFNYYASWIPAFECTPESTDWKPYSAAAIVASDNMPLVALAWLLVPALAAGNCVCLCVPSKTSLTAMLLAEIFVKAGLPPGVFNVIPASQKTVEELVLHKDVLNIRAFGSTNFVREMKQKLSEHPSKPISTVMSGRTPMLVFSSADMHSAIENAVRSVWQNQGSVPWAVKLLLVQETIYPKFVKKLKRHVKDLRIGNSFHELTDSFKPYVENIVENFTKMTALATDNGLEVYKKELTDYEIFLGYLPPTLLIGGEVVSNQVIECQDYAPLISVVPFRTAKEAVTLANNSRYGLAASIWTNNLTLAMDVSDGLQFGTVWINCHGILDPSVPIQGWKESGCRDFGGKAGYLDCLYLPEQKSAPVAEENANGWGVTCTDLTNKVYKTDITYKLYHSGGYKNANGNAVRTIVLKDECLFTFPEANRKDVRMAVETAAGAIAGWSSNVNSRAKLLHNISLKIDASANKLTSHFRLTQSTEDSVTTPYMVSDASAAFKYWAHNCDKASQICVQKPGFMVNTSREPLGLIGLGIYSNTEHKPDIFCTPIWQLAAALAFGNPVLVVVDMLDSSGALELFKAICEAGIPPGVLSVLVGNSFTVMKCLAEHQSVNAIFHWNYPLNLVKDIELVACVNLKRVRSCIMGNQTKPAIREFVELSVTQSKAVWISKGDTFIN